MDRPLRPGRMLGGRKNRHVSDSGTAHERVTDPRLCEEKMKNLRDDETRLAVASHVVKYPRQAA